ncbi:MAG TPA: hypothetical protein DEA91_06565 [Paenibacillus sp.]|nr:hypothetical protein [Paenibacillus sp.]
MRTMKYRGIVGMGLFFILAFSLLVYRIKVLVNDSVEILGLKIRSIRMSQKLFINGKQEGQGMVPSSEFKERVAAYPA